MEEEKALVLAQFKDADSNRDGTLAVAEFSAVFQKLNGGKSWSGEKLKRLFTAADVDHNGSIDVAEFISWMFDQKVDEALHQEPKKKGRGQAKKEKGASGVPKHATAQDAAVRGLDAAGSETEDSDESGSDGDGGKVRKGKPVITAQAMYELLSMEDGVVGARMSLGELGELFAKCKLGGLGPRLARCVPQAIGQDVTDREPEDVSTYELGHLCMVLKSNPRSTDEEILQKIAAVKASCRGQEYRRMEDVGLESSTGIGYGLFLRILRGVAVSMLIDEEQILAQLLWAHADYFELTEQTAVEIMRRVFLKYPKQGKSVLRESIQGNDFMRMCHVQNLSDNKARKGIPHAKLSLFFGATLRNMPDLLDEREERKSNKAKRKAKDKKERPPPESIRGRAKLSVLIEELYQAMPKGLYGSPLALALSLLEGAGAAAPSADAGHT